MPLAQIDAETAATVGGSIAGGGVLVVVLARVFNRLLGSFDNGQAQAQAMVDEAKDWARHQVDDARAEVDRKLAEEREFHQRRFGLLEGDYKRVAADGDRCRQELADVLKRIATLEGRMLAGDPPAPPEGDQR